MSTTNRTETISEAELERFLLDKAMKEEQARAYPNPHPFGSKEYFDHERSLISMRQDMLPKLEAMVAKVRKMFNW